MTFAQVAAVDRTVTPTDRIGAATARRSRSRHQVCTRSRQAGCVTESDYGLTLNGINGARMPHSSMINTSDSESPRNRDRGHRRIASTCHGRNVALGALQAPDGPFFAYQAGGNAMSQKASDNRCYELGSGPTLGSERAPAWRRASFALMCFSNSIRARVPVGRLFEERRTWWCGFAVVREVSGGAWDELDLSGGADAGRRRRAGGERRCVGLAGAERRSGRR